MLSINGLLCGMSHDRIRTTNSCHNPSLQRFPTRRRPTVRKEFSICGVGRLLMRPFDEKSLCGPIATPVVKKSNSYIHWERPGPRRGPIRLGTPFNCGSVKMFSTMKVAVFSLAVLLSALLDVLYAADKPNILWFVVDDMSANFSCYGERSIKTPQVDRLGEMGQCSRMPS